MNLSQIIAGDTLNFATQVPQFPAIAGWQLSYVLAPQAQVPGAGPITLASTPDTADPAQHRIQVGASITAQWVAGSYGWTAFASRTGERHTLARGTVSILPNPATASLMDTRSAARRALDAVEAYLADPKNLTAAKYQIAGRSLDRYPLADLWKHRDRLRMEVRGEDAAERLAAGLPDNRRVYVRFGA